ncbi:MAG: sugar phosphate isomerase/epimerase [Oscillospiraceae bacterium]|nr:sugar phosphate isomerase/epimerase [Oscillospiraceae bacterium]
MKIGLSTGCFFPLETTLAVEKAGRLGAKYIEIFFNTHSELEEEYLLKIKRIADSYGMQIVSIHPYTSAIESFMFFSKFDYKLEDSIQLYEAYFKACNILGCKYVVMHGCLMSYDFMDMRRYCDNLNRLSRRAREYGVYISQENVYNFKCGYIKNIEEFLKYADKDIKFTFDIKQAVKARQSIYRILDLVKDRISHVHISDYKGRTHSLVPFDGSFGFDRFFRYLKENTTAEAALVELYSPVIKGDMQLVNTLHKLEKYV